jgi:hypothetical protein
VSGAKPPRFARASVEDAVESVRGRITQVNEDSHTVFRHHHAVAFGDSPLTDRARVQIAEVGVGLAARGMWK